MERYSYNLYIEQRGYLPSFFILIPVVLFHAILIFFLISYTPKIGKDLPKKLIVRTITLQPPPQLIAIEPMPEEIFIANVEEIPSPTVVENPVQQEEPKIVEEVKQIEIPTVNIPQDPPPKTPIQEKKPIKKIEEKKQVKNEVKKVVPQKKPVTKKAQPKKQIQKQQVKKEDTRLKDAKNAVAAALAKLENSQNVNSKKRADIRNSKASFNDAPECPTLSTDTEISFERDPQDKYSGNELTYYDELVSRLKLFLRLPEYGKVQLKITLSSQGKILNILISDSKSAKNRVYLEKNLPKISFPSFGGSFNGAKEHTFSLSVLNELSY